MGVKNQVDNSGETTNNIHEDASTSSALILPGLLPSPLDIMDLVTFFLLVLALVFVWGAYVVRKHIALAFRSVVLLVYSSIISVRDVAVDLLRLT